MRFRVQALRLGVQNLWLEEMANSCPASMRWRWSSNPRGRLDGGLGSTHLVTTFT